MTMTRASDTIRTILSDLDLTCEVIIVLYPTVSALALRSGEPVHPQPKTTSTAIDS